MSESETEVVDALDNPVLLRGGYESPNQSLKIVADAGSHEIIPGLVIGSLAQCGTAKKNGYVSIGVRHIACHVPGCIHKHFLDLNTFVASRAGLESFSDEVLDIWYRNGKKVFVHCFHGIERAPLAVAYFIKREVTPLIPFADVYRFVLRQRPCALDRTNWLEHKP